MSEMNGEEISNLKVAEKEKLVAAEQAHEQQLEPVAEESQPASGKNNSWIAGVTIIAVGVIFLISNLTDFSLNNWWALFILIPGVMSFVNAWQQHTADGGWSKRARGGIIGGLGITLVAVIFLLDLDWGKVWPLFLILGGVAALLGGWFRD